MSRRELAGGGAILVLLVALFHGPAIKGAFVYDDHWTIVDNPFLRAPAHLADLLGPGPARAGVPDAGRPVMVATEMLDHALWGLRPWGYHLQSLLWHAATAVLFLVAAAGLTGSFPVAFAAAAVFAVHPAHVEAVAAIHDREDLLATFFTLASLAVLGAGRGRTGSRLAAALLIWLGGLSKESAMMAPVLLVTLEVCGLPRAERRSWRGDLLALGVPLVLVALWRAWVMGGFGVVSRTAQLAQASPLATLPEGAAALVLGTLGLVLPVWRFSPEYDPVGGVGWLALVLVLAAAVVAWWARRRHPFAALGILGGVAAYLPILGLVPISNLRADRYLYLPSLAILLALAACLIPRLERARWLQGSVLELPRFWVVLAAMVMALGVRTLAQGRVWRSDVALWTQGTRVAPRSPRAWSALAEARLRAGHPAAARDAVERSLALLDDASSRELLGIVLMESGAPGEARVAFERALAIAPQRQRPELLNDLGACELRLGLPDSALRRFAAARALDPGYERAWLNAARTLEQQGRPEEALALLRELVAAVPESFDGWAALGAALEAAGQEGEARDAYRRAVALGHPDPAVSRAAARLERGR